MPHVDDGRLHALLDGALRAEDPEGAAAVERHLAGCEDCRARLDAAAEVREGARSILDAATPAAVEAVPDFREVRARAGAHRVDEGTTAGGTSRRGTRRRMAAQVAWNRRAAWAASLVVALGTGYLLRDLADPPAPTTEARLLAPAAAVGDGEAGTRDGSRSAADSRPDPSAVASAVPSAFPSAVPSADSRPDAARDEAPPTGASGSTEDRLMADRGGSGAGSADGQTGDAATGAAGVARGAPATPIADTPAPQRQIAADEQTVVATRRAEALEERRAADELVTAQRAWQLSVTGADAPSAITSAITSAPEAAPGRAPAMAVAGIAVVEPEAVRWWSVALEDARRSLDGPVYVLPRAAILELYVSADTTAPRVMSRQRLESGILVEVVQWRGQAETPAGAVVTQAEKAAEPETEDRSGLPTPEVARVVRGPFLLQVTGSLPGDLLAILAASATPAP